MKQTKYEKFQTTIIQHDIFMHAYTICMYTFLHLLIVEMSFEKMRFLFSFYDVNSKHVIYKKIFTFKEMFKCLNALKKHISL